MCGILGISSTNGKNIADKLYTGLSYIQHRGKESAGIALNNDKGDLHCEVGQGLILEALTAPKLIRLAEFNKIGANNGIAHTRYSTFGSADITCAQPMTANFGKNKFAISLNGNIVNTQGLKIFCLKKKYEFISDTDTEIIAALISLSECQKFEDAVKEVLRKLKGAFSVIFLFENRIYAARDALGIRPLCIGKHDTGYILTSESLVIDKMSARYYRDVEPGELIRLAGSRMFSENWHNETSLNSRFCIFEFIYFSFPQSLIMGRSVASVREEMGCLLFEDYPLKADFVVGVPDSGRSSAYGYSVASGIPIDDGVITRNRAVRSFISSDNTENKREFIRNKFNIDKNKVENKNIIVIDDSVVKANVSYVLCQMLRDAGVKKVHWLSASPPYKYPCYYGIDTWRVKDELVATRNKGDLEKMRQEIGPDSLGYLSLDSTVKATGFKKQQLCVACFDGNYPVQCTQINCKKSPT